jgi:hypothetical protein
MDELFDIVDENGVATGERKHRKLVHRDGVISCKIANPSTVYLHNMNVLC